MTGREQMDVSGLSVAVKNVDASPAEFAQCATTLEQLGYGGIWCVEGIGRNRLPKIADASLRSSIVGLSAAATLTKRVGLGTSIISIYGRKPLVTAMEALALSELSNNRFILGLGVGGPWVVRQGYGESITGAAKRAGEYLTIVRSLLDGEETTFRGSYYQINQVQLETDDHRIPIYLAALNRYMLRLAGRLADAVILNAWPPEASGFARKEIGAGARNARRDTPKILALALCAGPGDENIMALKRGVAFFCALETHQTLIQEAGVGEEARKICELWNRGQKEAAAMHVSDVLIKSLSLGAHASDVRTKVEAYRRVGVEPILYPTLRSGRAASDFESVLRSVKNA